MIRGTVSSNWERVDPNKYEFSEQEDKVARAVCELQRQFEEQTDAINKSICQYQDGCQHKVFKEYEEDSKNTWLGKEVKEYFRCVICDAQFVGYYYRLGVSHDK